MGAIKVKPKIVQKGAVESKFVPKVRKPGELILAEDWNDMQTEIKEDLETLAKELKEVGKKSGMVVASGLISHGMYVTLDWAVTPHVVISLLGTIDEPVSDKRMRSFAHDISSEGFSVYAQSEDGKDEGIVSWLAIGVL